MSVMRYGRVAVSLSATCCAASLFACSGNSGPAPAGPQTWQVQTGVEASASAIQGLAMYPNSVTIDAQDSITWTYPTHDVHTIALLGAGQTTPPSAAAAGTPAGGPTYDGSTFTNSGILSNGKTFTLKFTKPGTYIAYCLIHQPVMKETIVVQPQGAAYPSSQQDVTATGTTQSRNDVAAGTASVALFPFAAGGPHLVAGIAPGLATASPMPTSTVLRFLDGAMLTDTNVTIAAGTSVTWTNESSNEPHHIVVPPTGATPPPSISTGGGTNGVATYDGSTTADSGIFFAGQSYTLTFTKPGVYTYYCILHAGQGMVGTVTVQ